MNYLTKMMIDIYPPKSRKKPPKKRSPLKLDSLFRYLIYAIILLLIFFFGLSYLNAQIDQWLKLEPIDLNKIETTINNKSQDQNELNQTEANSDLTDSDSQAKTVEATDNSETAEPANNQTENPSSIETSAPTIDKTALKIQILNGNAIYGTAAKVKTLLENDGFKVSSLGNAQNQNYLTSVVYYKTDQKAAAELVKDSLAKNDYDSSVQENNQLVGQFDLMVVIGKK